MNDVIVPRANELPGRTIVQASKINPRRPFTQGYLSFQIVIDAGGRIRYEEYRSRGGRMQDLRWDLKRGRLKLAKVRSSRH